MAGHDRQGRWWIDLLVSFMLLVGVGLPTATPARAASTVVVNSLADTASTCTTTCTLRGALATAQSGDTITLGVNGTILLNSTLVVTRGVTIKGPGAESLAIDGQNAVAVFQVGSSIAVTFEGLTIRHGRNNQSGGGILYGSNSTVTVKRSTLSGNSAQFGGAIYNQAGGALNVTDSLLIGNTALGGGGIFSTGGTLNVTNSTLTDNGADAGGGLYVQNGTVIIQRSTLSANVAHGMAASIVTKDGGAIVNTGANLTITNSTLSGNAAVNSGGAIYTTGGTTSVSYSTLSDNAASSGGGIYKVGGSVTLRNSIVVRSPSGGNCSAAVGTTGNNLSDTGVCFGANPGANIVTSDPKLAALAVASPGTTATQALLAGSPAIDAVVSGAGDCGTTVATDQRGVARPQKTGAVARCDIGAFELGHDAPTISGLDDQSVGQGGSTPTVPFSVGSTEVAPTALVVTATSSNTALVPTSGIQISGTGTARAITVTPAARQSGEATITVKVSDGTADATEAFKVTVLQVNQVPTAAPDTYSVGATQTLTVTAGSGVLKNDTDADSGGLQAQIVSTPGHGSLELKPDGGFTYTPAPNYAGTDTFTYRASDGAATSGPATVTITVTPSRCAPRATVQIATAVVGGKLQATVEALPLDGQTNNRLKELRFGEMQNGKVTLNGQTVASGAAYIVPGTSTQVVFTVERATPGQPTTIPLTAVDECGAWPSFVGGGAGAGF